MSREERRVRAMAEIDEATHGIEWDRHGALGTAILDWHLAALDRCEAVDGPAPAHDGFVDTGARRFHRQACETSLHHIAAENIDLKILLFRTLAALSFYSGGGSDAGAQAKIALDVIRHHVQIGEGHGDDDERPPDQTLRAAG